MGLNPLLILYSTVTSKKVIYYLQTIFLNNIRFTFLLIQLFYSMHVLKITAKKMKDSKGSIAINLNSILNLG